MGFIYKITNLINGKIYIGQTSRLKPEIRWKEHLREQDSSPIHKAIRKYGKENFKFEIIEECENFLLDEKEIYYIKKYDSYNSSIGYNATKGGDGYPEAAIKWIKEHPKEVKQNLNKARMKAIEKFEQNPELKRKREEARWAGYEKYKEEHHEEWLQNTRNALVKAREALKKQYEEDPSKIIKRAQENGKKASRAVYQIDKNTNEILQEFESCSAAARFLNKDGGHSNISKACRKGSIIYGYKWAYVNP